MKTMSRPIATLAAIPQMASHADECGATITTTLSTSGHCPHICQPPRRNTLRPIQRVNALPLVRGALAGSVGTTGLILRSSSHRRGRA